MDKIQITLNEQPISIAPDITLFQLVSQCKPDADILVVNGFPAKQDCRLHDGDTVVLIKRGEMPSQEELEALRQEESPNQPRA